MNFDEAKQLTENGFSPYDCKVELNKDDTIVFVVYDNKRNGIYIRNKLNIDTMTKEQLLHLPPRCLRSDTVGRILRR